MGVLGTMKFRLYLIQETLRNWLNGGNELSRRKRESLIPDLPKELLDDEEGIKELGKLLEKFGYSIKNLKMLVKNKK